MIKHHPTFELMQSYVNGELPASLSIAITMHAEMCSECKHTISQLTEQVAKNAFTESEQQVIQQTQDLDQEFDSFFDDMISDITATDDADQVIEIEQRNVMFKGKTYSLPNALNNVDIGNPSNIGKLSRSRIKLDEDEIHTSLLQINPGGGVPSHTHKGFELTLLLDGKFTDHKGEYVKGDFIMLDENHHHNPVSEEGCLCYTVANDALHFTQGFNKLLNPIGNLIY